MRKVVLALLAGLLLCAQSPMAPGFPPGTFVGRGAIDAGAQSATTWNPSDASASLGLSGGNLIATANANNQGVRSIASVAASQKVYVEFVPTVNANNQIFGFALATHTLTTAVGGDGPSFGVRFGGTYQDLNSADNGAAMPSWTTGDRVGIAYDAGTNRLWSRVNGGAWSNSGDPAAGTGGRVVSVTGTIFACVYIAFSTEVTTVRFSSASWVDAAPTGFTQLQYLLNRDLGAANDNTPAFINAAA